MPRRPASDRPRLQVTVDLTLERQGVRYASAEELATTRLVVTEEFFDSVRTAEVLAPMIAELVTSAFEVREADAQERLDAALGRINELARSNLSGPAASLALGALAAVLTGQPIPEPEPIPESGELEAGHTYQSERTVNLTSDRQPTPA